MNREEILSTLVPFETETKVKVWLFEVDKNFYQVLEYGGVYRVPPTTAIWEANKRGKRLSTKELFKIDGKNITKCINLFLDKLEEEAIEKEINESN